MKFWLLTHKLGSWNFSVKPLISSLEGVILCWWEREGCCVEAKEEERKKNKERGKGVEKEGLDFWPDAAKKIRKVWRLLGQQNQIREVEKLGWIRVWLGKEISHPLSTFLHSHLYILCIHTYFYFYFFFAFTLIYK